MAAFGGIAHSPKRAYNRVDVSLIFVAARDGLRRFVERAGRERVVCGSQAIRRLEFEENRAWPTQAGTASQALSVSSSFYTSPAGSQILWEDLPATFLPPYSSPARRVRPLYVSALALLCRFPRRSHEEVQSPTSAPDGLTRRR